MAGAIPSRSAGQGVSDLGRAKAASIACIPIMAKNIRHYPANTEG
jgi:hypothetical protein